MAQVDLFGNRRVDIAGHSNIRCTGYGAWWQPAFKYLIDIAEPKVLVVPNKQWRLWSQAMRLDVDIHVSGVR
ncbi:hypothetical protein KL86APRO_11911 [uncultured Alphaproteobacteria bacterium]|uniref:Uncharacterized protein n=1 Tax=uncultured Alphaproteobacteria bacterium TaxID=91750 RepID=A0A212JZT5_9PROT|nr:hypothetical protein KL86APRO_11911 [uncultured Alphaproteobacteria bacterium]